MAEVEDVLRRFAGQWTLSRRIEDARAGTTGRFEGTARLTPDGGGLRYDETGLLSLPGAAPMQASRSYLWRAIDQRIAVLFEDGRPFHEFAVTADTARATHWCDPDDYRVSYSFETWPNWQAEWQVSGPRKSYRMISSYCPAD
ncbi:hypothetical protein CBW24_09030 [Pacificitalea manganoxidans]|uniref:DUF6314 domain-containing protein n=1 Tax=Pacificitalea manganoxidans TaxID=1411902 RepID=A0A291LZQ6_9RHOB|nr:DUF6314 family protein [Pacificitalea manganoxidans]ATI42140.1 hypothetical protein CBW24_09030 [Pacificitalea manganoxidans]MDR6308056.1 hypothetical protein [Pacificitalea manganoxidans]